MSHYVSSFIRPITSGGGYSGRFNWCAMTDLHFGSDSASATILGGRVASSCNLTTWRSVLAFIRQHSFVLWSRKWRTAYVQPCRRPTDERYGQNPNGTILLSVSRSYKTFTVGHSDHLGVLDAWESMFASMISALSRITGNRPLAPGVLAGGLDGWHGNYTVHVFSASWRSTLLSGLW